MLTELLIYDLKVAALIGVCYMFYRLLLERETLHRLNRVVLLTTACLSLVLPLCVITMHRTVWVEALPVSPVESQAQPAEIAATHSILTETVWEGLLLLFLAGIVARLLYIGHSYRQLLLLLRSGEQHTLPSGTRLTVVDTPVVPFSWMHTIVVSRADWPTCPPQILAHEEAHVRLRHSYDVVFVEILTALQWFNPTVWLLRQDLRSLHEYEADASVLSQGFSESQYIQLLMLKTTGVQACALVNGLGDSQTKKRIIMMLKKKSSRANGLKMLFLVPIAATSLALTARTVTEYSVIGSADGHEPEVGEQMIRVNPSNGKLPEHYQIPYNSNVKIYENDRETNWPAGRAIAFTTDCTMQLNGETFTAATTPQLPASTLQEIRSYSDSDGKPIRVNLITGTKAAPASVAEGDDSEPIFDVVEEMPRFPGGEVQLMKFIAENIKYPKEAKNQGLQGRVIVQFVIEKDGSVTGVRVAKPVSPLLDKEALRVIGQLPRWTPGKQKGKAVRCKFTLPITFRLN